MNKSRVKLKRLAIQSLNLILSGMITQPAYALSESSSNPYLQELDNSQAINSKFNYFFQKSLDEKQQWVEAQNISIHDKRYQAQSYLLQLPQVDSSKIQTQESCNLNNMQLYSYRPEEQLRYPMVQAFPPSVNNAYCLLQSTFQGLKSNDLKMIEPITENNDLYNQVKTELSDSKNDTLVVVVPGIFGEFIDQLGFGEVFGKGLSELDNPKFRSSFAKKFETHLKTLSSEDKSLTLDKRFLMSNLRDYYSSLPNEESKKYSQVDIKDWLKVSSLDDDTGNPLFKIALLGLAPMSLESIKEQKDLAILYLRRLNKFMKIYEKMNDGKLPSKIILVGYSRGTPVAYEMLTMLNNGANLQEYSPTLTTEEKTKKSIEIESLKTQALAWAPRIKAMISLGGVSLGTPLADASTIFRTNAPDPVKVLQAFKRLMFNLKIIEQHEVDDLYKAYQINKRNSPARVNVTNKYGILSIRPEASDLMRGFTKKVSANIVFFDEFLSVVENLEITKKNEKIKKGVIAVKKISNFYSDINSAMDGISSESNVERLKALTTILNQPAKISELATASNDLMEAGLILFPQMAEVSNVMSNANSTMKPSSVVSPDLKAQLNDPFTQLILNNYGFHETSKRWNQSVNSKNYVSLLSEFNLSVRKFQYFFQRTWNGASELGTLPRLNWLMENAKHLPTKVNYYSINGILNAPNSKYYQDGVGYGFNESKDETFLNKSWHDLMSVGKLDPYTGTYKDGLDFTFAGSVWNDSQVDWYKTLLWPTMIKAMSGVQNSSHFNAKVLGILRTHHWGLALPFAAHEATAKNPVTSEDPVDPMVPNVNPVPRAELLKAIIMSVHFDTTPNSSTLNHKEH